jgi:DNA-binding FadR family transcriptional regulator
VTTGHVGRILRAPKTAELIAADLRRQIVRGRLTSGQTLPPEVALMAQYGVSRPTLREAFRILEAEALISVRRGSRGGAQVMTPDLSVAARYVGLLLQIQGTPVDDIYEARMMVEPYCARLLARRRTRQDLQDLKSCRDELRRLVDAATNRPDPAQWSESTGRFHQLVVQRCGNRTMALQCEVLADIVATHLQLRVAQAFGEVEPPSWFSRTLRVYDKLIELVEARDGDAAEAHWRRHMEMAAKVLFPNDSRSRPVVELFA